MLGLPKWQIDAMFPVGGLLNAGQEASPERIEAIGGDPQGLLAPERPNGFWQGGEKIRGKDALAGLLAVISDTASQLGGNQGNAIEGLLGGRSSALDEFKKKAEQERKMQELIALGAANNIPENVVRAQAAGLKLPEQEKRKGRRPVAGPTGVYVWDGDSEQFVTPPGGGPGGTDSGWVDIDENEARRLGGGGTGNGAGGFPFRR